MSHRHSFWQQAVDLQSEREEAMASLADEKNREIEVGLTLLLLLLERSATV